MLHILNLLQMLNNRFYIVVVVVAVRRADQMSRFCFTSPVVLQFLGLLQYIVRVYMPVMMFTAQVLRESAPPFLNTDSLV